MDWITERVTAFIPQIELLGLADEATLQRLCEQEIENWRARGLAQASLNTPMTAMRTAIKKIPLTEHNTWIDPRKNEAKHIALKYMNYSPEEWEAIKASTKRTLMQRKHNRQLIERPDDYVQLITQYLASENWAEVVAAWCAAVGARLTEGLYTAFITVSTDYTVLFGGQLKQPSYPDEPPYEKPTLVPAHLLVEPLARLRQSKELADCSQLSLKQISQRYGQKVREAAREIFGGVVPVRAGKKTPQISTQDLRAVYACIAVHWFCPPEKDDQLYAATILGYMQGTTSDAEALERMKTEEHYSDYRMDGPQGQKLGEPGVVVLKAFQSLPELVLDTAPGPDEGVSTKKKKKRGPTGRSLVQVVRPTRDRVVARKQKLEMESEDEVIVKLLDQVEALEQNAQQLTPEHLGLDASIVKAIHEAMEHSRAQAFSDFLSEALEKEAKIRLGTIAQRQKKKGIDLTTLPTSKLEKQPKSPELTEERIRRAVVAFMLYNEQQSDPYQRVAITQNALNERIGVRFDKARDFLTKHQQVIAAHHRELQVPEKRSSKVKLETIEIPEQPEAFQGRFLPDQEPGAEAKGPAQEMASDQPVETPQEETSLVADGKASLP